MHACVSEKGNTYGHWTRVNSRNIIFGDKGKAQTGSERGRERHGERMTATKNDNTMIHAVHTSLRSANCHTSRKDFVTRFTSHLHRAPPPPIPNPCHHAMPSPSLNLVRGTLFLPSKGRPAPAAGRQPVRLRGVRRLRARAGDLAFGSLYHRRPDGTLQARF